MEKDCILDYLGSTGMIENSDQFLTEPGFSFEIDEMVKAMGFWSLQGMDPLTNDFHVLCSLGERWIVQQGLAEAFQRIVQATLEKQCFSLLVPVSCSLSFDVGQGTHRISIGLID